MGNRSGIRYLLCLFRFLAVAFVLTACAASPRIVDHTFAFDVVLDSPDATLLDYRYGNSEFPGTSNTEDLRKEGRSAQRLGTTGGMPPGESLYVKWRIKSTNEVVERTIDLKDRLPRDIAGHIVYFAVNGQQLYVYLISRREQRPAGAPLNGPGKYRQFKTTTIYPDQTKP